MPPRDSRTRAAWRLAPGALLLALLPAAPLGAQARTEPEMAVTLEREALVARDSVAAALWVRNPAAAPLRDVRLHVAAPGFLDAGVAADGACGPARGPIVLGEVPAGSVARRVLCLRTGREVVEGDYNLVFTLTYRRMPVDSAGAPAGAETEGYVQAAKAVKVGVLGTESVAGVSLRLLALLLPGIVFFIGLRRMGVVPGVTVDKGEAAVLAVLFSLALAASLDALSPAAFRRGMSVERLLLLCAGALLLAAAVAAGAALVRWYRSRNLVDADDPASVVLEKLLRQRWGRHVVRVLLGREKLGHRAPVEVTLKEGGERLCGSLIGDTAEGGRVLAGWFQVGPVADPGLQRKVERLQARGWQTRLARRLRAEKVKPELRTGILRGPEREEGTDEVRRFPPGAVQTVGPMPDPREDLLVPLVVRSRS